MKLLIWNYDSVVHKLENYFITYNTTFKVLEKKDTAKLGEKHKEFPICFVTKLSQYFNLQQILKNKFKY